MNYTLQAKDALAYASRISRRLHHYYIGTEHVLLGILHEQDSLAHRVLFAQKVSEDNLVRLMSELITQKGDTAVAERDGYTPKLNQVLEQAEQEAHASRAEEIGTEHLLLAIIRTPDCAAARLLNALDVDLQRIFTDIIGAMGEDGAAYRASLASRTSQRRGQRSALEQYSRDLTQMAREGKLDPVIGREKEIQRVVQILSRRTKNNPCLIGEPGVGKTAIAEGLAQRIASDQVPASVQGKRLLSLDLAGMVAGSKFRGEFEERIRNVISEVIRDGNVILFVDEMHTLIGAGGAEGALDASNILKPVLARSELQMIGATTVTEYRKYVEKDAALERRFQPIMVEEPSEEDTVAILKGIRAPYEKHHGIVISDEAVEACVHLSTRYITDRFLPDKAIDLMDESASRLRLKYDVRSSDPQGLAGQITDEENQVAGFLKAGNLEEARTHRENYTQLVKEEERLRKRQSRRSSSRRLTLSSDDVAEVVAEWTGIPVTRLNESEAARLRNLEKTLHKRIIGQEEAVSAVARAVRRGRVGLKEPGRPIGSFLFLGPTGVGKTEVSKALAEAVFGSEDALIRVDMTEYMEKQSVSKMIGSPPGYVGYEEGGQLSEKVRRNPYSVILFDEIEKAHPDVFNVLLQVLDDGHITDSQGRTVDFKNTIIIMTSNAGAQEIVEPKKLGFGGEDNPDKDYQFMKNRVMDEVHHIFKPEFLNRIDEVIVFRMLSRDDLKSITGLLMKSLIERCNSQMGIQLIVRDSLKKYIVDKSYNPKYGARPLRRRIQTDVEDPLAEELLGGSITRGSTVIATVRKGHVVFDVKS